MMNITTLERLCREYPDVRINYVDTTELDDNYYRGFGSWRGDYFQPAIFFKDCSKDKYMTLTDLLVVIDKLTDGSKYEGYKGGLFSFENVDWIHFECNDYCYTDYSLLEFLHPDDITPEIEEMCK